MKQHYSCHNCIGSVNLPPHKKYALCPKSWLLLCFSRYQWIMDNPRYHPISIVSSPVIMARLCSQFAVIGIEIWHTARLGYGCYSLFPGPEWSHPIKSGRLPDSESYFVGWPYNRLSNRTINRDWYLVAVATQSLLQQRAHRGIGTARSQISILCPDRTELARCALYFARGPWLAVEISILLWISLGAGRRTYSVLRRCWVYAWHVLGYYLLQSTRHCIYIMSINQNDDRRQSIQSRHFVCLVFASLPGFQLRVLIPMNS